MRPRSPRSGHPAAVAAGNSEVIVRPVSLPSVESTFEQQGRGKKDARVALVSYTQPPTYPGDSPDAFADSGDATRGYPRDSTDETNSSNLIIFE